MMSLTFLPREGVEEAEAVIDFAAEWKVSIEIASVICDNSVPSGWDCPRLFAEKVVTSPTELQTWWVAVSAWALRKEGDSTERLMHWPRAFRRGVPDMEAVGHIIEMPSQREVLRQMCKANGGRLEIHEGGDNPRCSYHFLSSKGSDTLFASSFSGRASDIFWRLSEGRHRGVYLLASLKGVK